MVLFEALTSKILVCQFWGELGLMFCQHALNLPQLIAATKMAQLGAERKGLCVGFACLVGPSGLQMAYT